MIAVAVNQFIYYFSVIKTAIDKNSTLYTSWAEY